MSLDLDLEIVTAPRVQGRAPKPVVFEVVRHLEPEELDKLEEERGTQPIPIKALRARHHNLARLLASGKGESEAARMTGYTPSRVSSLKKDPAFQELMSVYQGEVDELYFSSHEILDAVSRTAGEILLERMEEEPEKMTNAQLTSLMTSGADRTGHGPQSKSEQNVNHTFRMADRMAAAKQRLLKQDTESPIAGESGPVIDMTLDKEETERD